MQKHKIIINDFILIIAVLPAIRGERMYYMISSNFRKRILDERCVETRKYRYIIAQEDQHVVIERLPLELIGTTKALDSWEIVEILY